MPIQVSYMGTKRQIAPIVAQVISEAPGGPLLDLFSGICAVTTAVAPSRQVWCNDAQRFAANVASAFFTSARVPISFDDAAHLAHQFYRENRSALAERFSVESEAERSALATGPTGDLSQLQDLVDRLPRFASSPTLEKERLDLTRKPKEFPYRLFTLTFSGGYLGIEQCIQVDAIRYATDRLCADGVISDEDYRWMCLALCQAVCKVSTTTGHFAQFMKVKENNKKRFIAQRRRSVWREWLSSISTFVPIGTRNWRSKNKVFCADSVSLLDELWASKTFPAVIYADPPYTADHYSRYYHLYETLLRYDYPSSYGVGRYRPDRFVSQFSVKTAVRSAIEALIKRSARIGSRLILSYPENGLLHNSQEAIMSSLIKNFGTGEIVRSVDHFHSSLGGSNGIEKYAVKEIIYAAG